MDEKTTELIRELADKLGTTGEHLWGVLVRQAPITGTIDLLMMAIEQVEIYEGKLLRRLLEERGYDITTLKLTIRKAGREGVDKQ